MYELPNRHWCSTCFTWGQMCAACYGRKVFGEGRCGPINGEINMCKCNGNQHYSCDDCSRYYDLLGTFPKNSCKTVKKSPVSEKGPIDWTKPIRWNKRFSASIRIGYIGSSKVCVVNEHEHAYLVSKHDGQCCDVGLHTLYVENIPEPKPQKWVNVYWNCRTKKIEGGLHHATEAKANENNDGSYILKLLGTFRVE